MLAVHNELRPPKPELLLGTIGFCEEIWRIMTDCWSDDPLLRPDVARLAQLIGRLRGEEPDAVLIDILKRLGKAEAEFVEDPCRELVMMAAGKSQLCMQANIAAATAGLSNEIQSVSSSFLLMNWIIT